MAEAQDSTSGFPVRLYRAINADYDHVRGGTASAGAVGVVVYGDYLCPYCRRLGAIVARLREVLGERLAYVFRHFPNEGANPGAHFVARAAEAAANQDRFWDMHDRLYQAEPPFSRDHVTAIARDLGLDMERFEADLDSKEIHARVDRDLNDGRRNGVSGTPTFFIDGMRYDGAWDFHSMLETLQRPVAQRLQRSARVFASLPASSGLVLILAAVAALVCANTLLAPYYRAFIGAPFGVGPPGSPLSMPVGDWFSEGLLAAFFLIVGLEIRRELTAGALVGLRLAVLPIVAAAGGVIAPALIYLSISPGAAADGWSVPTATDIAFTLGILALLGERVPTGLRVFVAALAVVDDVLSVLTLAIFYPHGFQPMWLVPCAAAVLALVVLNRWRVYASWPYLAFGLVLWFSLHSAGVHAALAGIFLAGLLPTRPTPTAAPLLAQAATALAALEFAEDEIRRSERPDRAIQEEPVWDWASRNLSAASDRLLSPADRFERALAPWTAYFILPVFAFSATGVGLNVDLAATGASHILLGVIAGLVVGKPLGILTTSALAVATRTARMPDDVSITKFVGAACLCGVGDTVALLMADQAFPGEAESAVAKIGVLIGSVCAAAIGAGIIAFGRERATRTGTVAG